MNKKKYSEDLINMAGSAFLRDSAFFDATDRNKAKDWVCKLGKRNNYRHVYYYRNEEVTDISPNEFILEDKRFIDFVNNKAVLLLDKGWLPIEKEVKKQLQNYLIHWNLYERRKHNNKRSEVRCCGNGFNWM